MLAKLTVNGVERYVNIERGAVTGSAAPPEARPAIPRLKPGTKLKRMLSRLGIKPVPKCVCNAMAVKMDLWGASAGEHIEEIVAAMMKERERRLRTGDGLTARGRILLSLPFSEFFARQLVKRAIRRAEGLL